MSAIVTVRFFGLLIAQAADSGSGASSSWTVTAMPILAVTILMFWFRRHLRVNQAKHKEQTEENHLRRREKISRTLDRIIKARDPKDEDPS